MTSTLPPTHRALVQEVYAEPLVVQTRATPQPTPGSAIIKILYAPVISYMRDVYDGTRNYKYPTPMVAGTNAIGYVAALGPDAVRLKIGDLVYFDSTIHGRDDQGAIILAGLAEGGTEASKKLMHGEWRDATFAEYAKVPLENVYVMDEERLCGPLERGGLGYGLDQLPWAMSALVPFGGLRSINVQPGETVLIAPATGHFGSAGVIVALAMGARVVAMGRNADALKKLKTLSSRVETVEMTGDFQSELAGIQKYGKLDAFLDISPRVAQQSTHFKAGILSLRHEGRVCFMGGLLEDLPLPHRFIMRFDITLRGKWMYSRADNFAMLGMLNAGLIDLHKVVDVVGVFGLEEWKKAFDAAYENARMGQIVLLRPQNRQ